MSRVRVGVVGLGHAANDFHLPLLSRFDDVEIGLCDFWPDRLAEGQAQWKVPSSRCFPSLASMMDKYDPQAVYVLIPQYVWKGRPPSPHPEVVREVLRRQKPVFVEKPLAMTYAEAKILSDAAAKSGVVTTQVGFQRRFNPLLRMGLQRVYERGPLLNCFFAFFKGEPPYADSDVIPIPPYDYLTLDFIHCLDLMRWVPRSAVVDFFSTTGGLSGEPTTQFHALAKFDNGCTGIFTSNMRSGARILEFQLHGIGISVYINMNPVGSHYSAMVAHIFIDNRFDHPEIIHDHEVAPDSSSQACVGFWQENRHFIDCVKKGIATECGFADAAETSRLCEQILSTDGNRFKTKGGDRT